MVDIFTSFSAMNFRTSNRLKSNPSNKHYLIHLCAHVEQPSLDPSVNVSKSLLTYVRWHSIFVLVEYIQDHVNNNNPILEIVRTYSSSQIWTSNSLLIRVCTHINIQISFNSCGPSFVRNCQSCTQWIFLEPLFDRVCLNVSYHRSYMKIVVQVQNTPKWFIRFDTT